MDAQALLYLNSLSSPVLDVIMLSVTALGDVISVVLITACVLLVLHHLNLKKELRFVLLAVVGAIFINIILKLLFARQRPELWELLVYESTYSFPSGHALLTATLAFVLGMLTWQTRWRWTVVSIVAGYALAVGVSRMYLGVHYPSDVLAGWLVAFIWIGVVSRTFGIIKASEKKNRRELSNHQE